MLGLMEMRGGVFVVGRIAAAYVAACQAQTEVDPFGADSQAFFAAGCTREDRADPVEMRADAFIDRGCIGHTGVEADSGFRSE